jgi:hypothetical protein
LHAVFKRSESTVKWWQGAYLFLPVTPGEKSFYYGHVSPVLVHCKGKHHCFVRTRSDCRPRTSPGPQECRSCGERRAEDLCFKTSRSIYGSRWEKRSRSVLESFCQIFRGVIMPTRAEILDTLAASQTQVIAFFQGLSPEDLECPATASEVPGAAPWRAKDHLAHLVKSEHNRQQLLRLYSPVRRETFNYVCNTRRACRCRASWAIGTR